MNSSHLICRPLTDIADIERAQKNKKYPKGTLFIQVSAHKRNADGMWDYLREAGELESKYAVIFPKIDVIPGYLVMALENATDEWLDKYVGKAINISMELFKYLIVSYHPDARDQAEALEQVRCIQELIAAEEKTVKKLEEMKK